MSDNKDIVLPYGVVMESVENGAGSFFVSLYSHNVYATVLPSDDKYAICIYFPGDSAPTFIGCNSDKAAAEDTVARLLCYLS